MNVKDKILVITSSYPMYPSDINGGFVHELTKRLTTDFDVFVLAPWQKKLKKEEFIDKVKIYRHKQFFFHINLAYGIGIFENLKRNPIKYFVVPFYFLFQFIALFRIVNKESIKVIHAHWLIPNAFIAVLYKMVFNKKIKIITTIHGSDFWGLNNVLGKKIKRFSLKYIDILTVVSNELKKALHKFGYKKEIYVYPMGVDTSLFSPDKKKIELKSNFNIEHFFLLFVGSIVETKGINYLIEAMPLVIDKLPNTKLLVIGDGILKPKMIELSRQLNIANNVMFIGSIPHIDLPVYFATADLFVLPSLSEGFGLVIAEALSCSTLTVSSNLKPINDIITDNETGFYFERLDTNVISRKIIEILNNKDNLKNIGIQGRKHIVLNFDWSIIQNKYANVIKSVLNE